MDCRAFSHSRHIQFTNLSRDYNPIHVDPIAARRTYAGAPIVHGIHSLLWLLESVLEQRPNLPEATGLKVQFRKPIYVDEDECAVQLVQLTANAARARLLVDGAEAVVARIGFGGQNERAAPLTQSYIPPVRPPAIAENPSIDAIQGRVGCLSFGASSAEAASLFPSVHRYIGAVQTHALICSSCLIGMLIPGLHSLFVGLDVSLSGRKSPGESALAYRVVEVDSRFRFVRIGIAGGGLCGVLEAVSRFPPVVQQGMTRISEVVSKGEFQHSSALIVGGSRGLGELAAKVIAAGGGRVAITYATGRSDADAVAAQIRGAGASCQVLAYDVREDAAQQLSALNEPAPSHIYYFATPLIAHRKRGIYDKRRAAECNQFYLTGFFDLVQAAQRAHPTGIRVFYPSTTFVESRPTDMTEYAMSKAAGEILCADLHEQLPGVKLLVRRLPPLLTDQTNSACHPSVSDPLDVILPIVREMHCRELNSGTS